MDYRVQIGCGRCTPDGWINTDSSWSVYLCRIPGVIPLVQKFHGVAYPKSVRRVNVARKLPVPAGSAIAVYASHVFEHLALDEIRVALEHIHVALAPGGVLRVVMPDLQNLVDVYTACSQEQPAVQFMRSSGMAREHGGFWEILLDLLGHRLRWLWDYRSFASELARAGFADIREARIGDRLSPDFSAVEQAESWASGFGVHCVKTA